MTFKNILSSVEGYIQLGMLEEAWKEMDNLTPEEMSRPESHLLKAELFIASKEWDAALVCLLPMLETAPQNQGVFLHAAFCLHELKRTEEAKECLLAGPSALKNNPFFHYNLACYEAQTGRLLESIQSLKKAVEMERQFWVMALQDPDLNPIREWLKGDGGAFVPNDLI